MVSQRTLLLCVAVALFVPTVQAEVFSSQDLVDDDVDVFASVVEEGNRDPGAVPAAPAHETSQADVLDDEIDVFDYKAEVEPTSSAGVGVTMGTGAGERAQLP